MVCDSMYKAFITNTSACVKYVHHFARNQDGTPTSFLAGYVKSQKIRKIMGLFILDHGNTWIYKYIADQQAIISTKYPINPECGTGIYLG